LQALGGGPPWELHDGSLVTSTWYQRQAMIPAEWRGRKISLHCSRICTDVKAYVNGLPCGIVAWPWGSVDITRAATPAKMAEIRLLAAAIVDPEKAGKEMFTGSDPPGSMKAKPWPIRATSIP
jgi:beta-galactosidase